MGSLPIYSDRRFIQLIEQQQQQPQELESESSSSYPYHLLKIATICGNGIEYLPIAGTDVELHTGIDEESGVRSLIREVCKASIKFNRLLVCRLIPVPGKKEGDSIDFEKEGGGRSGNDKAVYCLHNCSKT